MADTTSVTAINTDWTEILDTTLQAIITPVIPGNTFIYRYASSKPDASVIIGHKFFAKDDNPNEIIGSLLSEKCWIRSVNGTSLVILVTQL